MKVKSNFNEKLCAIIVTYNPDIRIREVVDACMQQVDFIYIVDNASAPEKSSLIEMFNNKKFANKIDIFFNDKNVGLPKAYNHAIKKGIDCNCGSFIFLDQDSILEDNAVQNVKEVFSELSKSRKVGALNLSNNEAKTTTLELLISRIHERDYRKGYLYSNDKIKEVKTLINSGLFITRNILEQVGFFSEELFVDSVDLDLSFKLRNAQLRMFLVINAKILHNFDSDYISKSCLIVRNHDLDREYHIINDGLAVINKWYKKYFISCIVLLSAIILGILIRILFLPRRWKRFKVVMNTIFLHLSRK
jgi:rhamnosyltransferase